MLKIRKAGPADLDRIMEIYRSARERMAAGGNPDQWGNSYPPQTLVEEDIRMGISFVIEDDRGREPDSCLRAGTDIRAVFVVMETPEPSYGVIDGSWLNDRPYLTIHRVARDDEAHGIFPMIIDFCRTLSDNIRIDTHQNNQVMQGQIVKAGFVRCGIIRLDDGSPRIAYHWEKA